MNSRQKTNETQNIDPVTEFLKSGVTPARSLIRASIILSCLNGMAIICGAWVLARIVNDIIFHHKNQGDVFNQLMLLAAIYALRSVLVFFSEQAAQKGAGIVKLSIRRRMIDTILASGPARMKREKSGDIISAYLNGVEALHNYYALTLPSRMSATFIPLAIFLLIVPVDFISGSILLVTAPLIPVFMVWIGKGAEKLNQRQWRRLTYMGGYFLDRLQGLATLKLFNASKREANIIATLCREFRYDTMDVLKIAFLSSLAMEFFATVSIAMIAVLIGFRLLWGEISFLQGFFVLLLAPEFYLPLRKMGGNYHAKMEAIGAAEKITQILAEPEDKKSFAPFIATGISIKFENVTFAYEDRAPVLSNVSFEVAAGERVGLSGPSGTGKSTLIALVLGFVTPQAGRILINGRDLREIDPRYWRNTLSWMPQRPRLFAGSVAENIHMANPGATTQQIADLIDSLGITEYQASPLGEDSAGISGGQSQRIAAARALVRSSSLLLLDEPTAHLDRMTASLLHHTIFSKARNATILFAAHRSSSLDLADRIFVLSDGHVTEKLKAEI